MTSGVFRFNVIAVSLIALLLLLSGETEEGVVMKRNCLWVDPDKQNIAAFHPIEHFHRA